MNRRKRWRTLRFEGLETRVLLAADLFAAVESPATDLCVASYCETAAFDGHTADSDLGQVDGKSAVHVNISSADRGSADDAAINDLAFARLGSKVLADRPIQ